jgi:glutathione S-transferase
MSIKLVSFKLRPFVQRAIMLLEEKALAYTLEYIELDDPPEWFRQRSPFGKVPLRTPVQQGSWLADQSRTPD